MKIKFDIRHRQQIESGEYWVVTDNETPVTIQRWDLKGSYPILAVIPTEVTDYEGEEIWTEDRPYIFTKEGISHSGGKFRRLYIKTGNTLTEAERIIYDKINDHVKNREMVDEEEVHEWMTENFLPVLYNELNTEKKETK